MGIDPPAVLDLHWNPPRADRQDEIHLRLGSALREVVNVEIRNRGKEIPQDTFSQVSRQIGQVRVGDQALRIEGHNLLKPGGAKRMIAQAHLRR